MAYFNRSLKSYYSLHQKQAALGYKQHSLINDIVTEWNSSYHMIQRALEQQQPLCVTILELKKGDLIPTNVEFSNMELFMQVMKSIVEITKALDTTVAFGCSSLSCQLLHTYMKLYT